MHVAALQRSAFGGDRAKHAAVAQQFQGVVLVVHTQVEQVAVALVQLGDGGDEPGVQRIVVDRQRNRRKGGIAAAFRQQFGNRFGLQCLHRPHPPQQHFAGSGRAARGLTHHQHLAQPVLKRLDPLRQRRRADRQAACGGLEAAFFEHGGEGAQLRMYQVHAVPLQFFCTG
eukprot:TRINITY_DN131429_c0_g5_i1.p1 TRINITY_DN131429_c0_g5~~TRINITY_DN131429_c0_g5_i1.p1  ORF type:complete len:171 (+),score=64.73 TRINITY_DN131429_c0_g5_i1:198-710(+)